VHGFSRGSTAPPWCGLRNRTSEPRIPSRALLASGLLRAHSLLLSPAGKRLNDQPRDACCGTSSERRRDHCGRWLRSREQQFAIGSSSRRPSTKDVKRLTITIESGACIGSIGVGEPRAVVSQQGCAVVARARPIRPRRAQRENERDGRGRLAPCVGRGRRCRLRPGLGNRPACPARASSRPLFSDQSRRTP
jgi:hypothetical protein